MRNPNRLVGVALAALFSFGVAWWQYQEGRVRQEVVQNEASPEPAVSHPLAPAPASSAPVASTAMASPAKPASSPSSNRDRAAKALGSFKAWAADFAAADEATRARLMSDGIGLARERKEVMTRLAVENPREFLRQALPYDTARALPEGVQDLVEKPVNGLGRVQPSWSVAGLSETLAKGVDVELNGARYAASFTGPRPARGQSTPLNGAALGGHVVLSTDAARVLSAAEVADLAAAGQLPSEATCAVTGQKVSNPSSWVQVGGRLLALCDASDATTLNQQLAEAQSSASRIALADVQPGGTNLPPVPTLRQSKGQFKMFIGRFRFPDDPFVPLEEDLTVQIGNRVGSILREWSYGMAEFVPTYGPLITLSQSRRFYTEQGDYFSGGFFGSSSLFLLVADIHQALQDAGYDMAAYDHHHFVVPPIPDSSTRGLGPFFNPPSFLQGLLGAENLWFATNPFTGDSVSAPSGAAVNAAFESGVSVLLNGVGYAFGHDNISVSETRSADRIPPEDPFYRLPPDNFPISAVDWFGFEGYNRNGLFAPVPPDVGIGRLAGNLAMLYENKDPFDIMGDAPSRLIGTAQFNAVTKMDFGWLPKNYVREVTGSSTSRLYAVDSPTLTPGNVYSIGVRKDVLRTCWLEHRRLLPENPWVSSGVLIHWGQSEASGGTVQLIDSTPGSLQDTFRGEERDFTDAAVVLGRTFPDSVNGIYITPTARGVDGGGEWMDVVIHKGQFEGNRAPSFDLVASKLEARSDEIITFTAANVVEPDGDPVAYHWDFSDGTFGDNQPTIQKTFSAGQHVVRCEVSDMKGGVAIWHVLVTIDGVQTTRVTGRVIDESRNPLASVRVAVMGDTNRATFTDSDGRYTIAGINSLTVSNLAHIHGYKVSPLGFENPSNLQSNNIAVLDYLAIRYPTISVDVRQDGLAKTVQFTREGGDMTRELLTYYRVDGSAVSGEDYSGLVTESNSVLFAAGQTLVEMPLTMLTNPVAAGDRKLQVSVLMDQTTAVVDWYTTNITVTNIIEGVITNSSEQTYLYYQTNLYPYPGWYVAQPLPGVRTWVQTEPRYLVGRGETEFIIPASGTSAPPALSLSVLSDSVAENGYDAGQILFGVDHVLSSDLSIAYTVQGDAVSGSDYAPLSGSVTIPAGSLSALLPVFGVPNTRIDGTRTLTVQLTPNSLYTLGVSNATVYLLDDDLPSVWVSAPVADAFEASGSPGVFRIARNGDISRPLVVQYLLAGSAVNGTDFKSISGSLVIPAGSDRDIISIEAIADGVLEDAETVVLKISSSPVYNIGTPSSATVTIRDDMTPVVSIRPQTDTLSTSEDGGAPINFVITRTGPTNSLLFVRYDTGGTADNGTDYRSIGNGAIIPAGQSNVVVAIVPINDLYREWIETMTIRLVPGAGYTVNPEAAQVTGAINENDGGALASIGFELESSVVRESAGQHTIGVALSGPPNFVNTNWVAEVRVISGSAVLSNDFFFTETNSIGSTGYVAFDHFSPRDRADDLIGLTTNINLTILDNTNKQGSRTVLLGLFYPKFYTYTTNIDTNILVWTTNILKDEITGEPIGEETSTNFLVTTNFYFFPTNWAYGNHRFHWLTILDDDASVVSVEAVAPFAYEQGAVPGVFRISRSSDQPFTEDTVVRFQISGNASMGADYESFPRYVTIPKGTNEVFIRVTPVDDTTFEGPEQVQIRLMVADGAKIGNDTASVTVVDDDGVIEFTEREYRFSEKAGQVQIPVRRKGDTSLRQTVDYAITAGTAESELDYAAVDGTLVFLPGETVKTIPVLIFDDPDLEVPETVHLSLGNLSGGVAMAGQIETTLVIVSEDTGFVFSTNRYAGAESAFSIGFKVQRVGNLSGTASVKVSTFVSPTDTAIAAVDFRGVTNRTISFGDGQSEFSSNFQPVNDALVEGDETLTLVLSDPRNGALDPATSTAAVTLRDDESVIEFGAAEIKAVENRKVARIPVLRRGGTLNSVSFTYFTQDGTATSPADYVSRSNIVTLKGESIQPVLDGQGGSIVVPGDTGTVLEIPIIDDTAGEGSESFTVRLANARTLGANRPAGTTTLGPVSVVAVQILDNELPGGVDAEYGDALKFTAVTVGTNAPASDAINAIVIQPGGRVVVAGDFTEVNDITLRHIARLDLQGRLDTAFNPGVGSDGTVTALAGTADGRIYVAGSFSQVGGLDRPGIARISADGVLDNEFDPGIGTRDLVRAVALQEGGYVLLGGDFTRFDGISRSRFVRLNSGGFVDPDFAPQFNGPVHAIVVQPDGRILVGGAFTTLNGASFRGLARLNADGTPDGSFNPGLGVNGTVSALGLDPAGLILVGGSFTSFDAIAVTNLVRLDSLGHLDPSFALGGAPDAPVRSISVHGSGRVLVAGDFTTLGGQPRNRFARLRKDGSVDVQFQVGDGADAPVRAIVSAGNSAVYLGGEFNEINGTPRNRFARVHGDEKISLSGAEFTQNLVTVSEGASKVSLTVRRTGDTNLAFTVTYATVAAQSTATAGSDYVATNGTLTFGPGVMSQTLEIRILQDVLAELTETVSVRLLDASSGVDLSGTISSLVQILDDESSVRFASPEYTVAESAGVLPITITRQGNIAGPASVVVSTVEGSAKSGADFAPLSTRLTFAAGEDTASGSVDILEDRFQEGVETFILRLSDPSEGLLISSTDASVSITDTDFDKIAVAATALVSDADGNGVLNAGERVTVNLALRNVGVADTTNLTATLQTAGNVIPVTGSQNYGSMPGEGSPVSRSFTFSNSASEGGSVTLILGLKDGTRDLGTVSTVLSVGRPTRLFSNTNRITINDNSPASPYPSTILVSGLSGSPLKVRVTLNGITHRAIDDVDIMLVAPNGLASVILSDVSRGPVTNITLNLDGDAADQLPGSGVPLFNGGRFRPFNYGTNEQFVAPAPSGFVSKRDLNFAGIDPNGTWSLFIQDDTASADGAIARGWAIEIETTGVTLPSTDVAVSIVESSDPVTSGQNLTYTLRGVNNGPAKATGVLLRQTLPAGANFVSASAGAVHVAGVVSAAVPELEVGASVEFQIVVNSTNAGLMNTSASISAVETDIFSGNNTVTIGTTVSALAQSVALQITPAGPGKFTVSWPENGSGLLESSPSLADGSWTPVTPAASLSGGRWSVTVEVSPKARFYRLRAD